MSGKWWGRIGIGLVVSHSLGGSRELDEGGVKGGVDGHWSWTQ